MSSSAKSEANELELVGKVEMKIALARDDKLESLLKIYLPPLLLKLASEYQSVRNKVISTCQHIKIRLAGNQGVVLPVAALLKQYKENTASPMLRHFDLMFIQQSVGKLKSAEQMALLPIILHGLASDAGNVTCATIFNLFLRLLPKLKIPQRGSAEDGNLRKSLGLDEHPDDAEFVAAWFSKLMLLTIVRRHTPGATCPGLSVSEYDFLTLSGKEEAWDASSEQGLNLTQTKILVMTFLASGAFTDDERFQAALFASADANSRISSQGDDLLKRTSVSLENRDLVESLMQTYFVLKPALQTRLLILFAKSAVSTTFPRQIIKIVQEAIQPYDNTNLPAKGLETTKFRNALFHYMNWVSRTGSAENLTQVAPQLVNLLRTYIEDQGWPVPHERSTDAAALRAIAYETLGSLARSTPFIVLEKELSLVKWLFRSVTEEGSSDTIFVSIEGALASLLNAFAAPLEATLRSELRSLLLKYMTLQEGDEIVRTARFATVRWANRCLDYSDVVGRWIDILALGGHENERSDVIEEGQKGLDPYWYRLLNSLSATQHVGLPSWNEMVNVLFTSASLLKNHNVANSMKSGMDVDGVSVFGNFSGSKIKAFPAAVNYCRRMILMAALEKRESPASTEADWERQQDVLVRSDKPSRKQVRAYIKSMDQDALFTYLSASFEGMLMDDGNGLENCGTCFVEIASLAPSETVGKFVGRAVELLPSIKSNNIATRFLAAQAFGIIAPHTSADITSVESFIRAYQQDIKPWSTAVGAEANKIHGSIVALGHILSRCSYYGRIAGIDQAVLQSAMMALLDILAGASDVSTKEAVFDALGQISASGVLNSTQIEKSCLPSNPTIDLLTAEAKKGNEKAINALGRLSLVFDEADEGETDDPLSSIVTNLYSLFELKQPEVHFAVGEALSFSSACWDSDALTLSLNVDAPYHGRVKRARTFSSMIQKLLRDCKATKPALKKASGIWLFSLIQYCGHLEEMQAQLRECQAAFMGLLSARDELVQETASRGLSLVYEQGDADLKEKLVKDLVASFTGTSAQLKVDEETQLFEDGALPTGEGKSVTSYKDIISLANEVGDQSLVYKFMSLASNAATWSTRAAFGRFGLSNILSESEVDPKLYPKLYRYRFDPNPNVQRSMNDIWSALVKDSSATVNKYFDEILADLLVSILGKEWRTRQASCAAIADLVQGRQFDKYEKHLHDIWQAAFKVLDDIKGSVRDAAMSLSMVLTGIVVRQVEADTSSKNAQAMLKEVLPFLLSGQGMENPAKEVRLFATDTVLKLIKGGGKALLPFVPELVEQLVALLSTFEMEGVDYLYLRASHYNLTEEKIDKARTTAVTRSPLMEAIDRCLDMLDEPAMAELVPRLDKLIKTTIGMPSKVGCGSVLVSLATRRSFIFRSHADEFLKIMERAVLDRNTAVAAGYARAAGYLARLGTDLGLLRLIKFCKDLYFNAEDETKRQVAAEAVYAVSKFATDRFNALAAEFLPFVFFAKHDFDEHVNTQFEKTWSENVGGSRAVLLYLKEINALALESLGSPKWAIKHTAALTVADAVGSAGSEISSANAAILWPALEKALALKTFDGKKEVLDAFVKFTKAGKAFWQADAVVKSDMKKIALREAKRNNDAYRSHAFATLGEYAEARIDDDMFDAVFEVVKGSLEDLTSEDRMESEDSKGTSEESSAITAGISAVVRAINFNVADAPCLAQVAKVLGIVDKVLGTKNLSIATRLAFYERIKALLEGLIMTTHEGLARYELAVALMKSLELPSGSGSEAVRIKRAEAAEILTHAFVVNVFGGASIGRQSALEAMKSQVSDGRKNERSLSVQAILDRALKALHA